MRKVIAILVALVIIVLGGSQILLPKIIGGRLADNIQEKTQAQSVDVDMSSFPAFRLLSGHVGDVDIVADKAMVGGIQVEKMTLHGEDVDVDFSAIDKQDGSAIRSAETLVLTGEITQEALQDMLVKRLERIDDLKATMDTEKLTASGKLTFFGYKSDVNLEGTVLAKDGGVYFHMTKLDFKNPVIGQAALGNFFGDVLLFDLHSAPIRAEVTEVQQQPGKVVITAEAAK